MREAANAKVPRDLGALVYRYSGEPVGAFFQLNYREMLVRFLSGVESNVGILVLSEMRG